MVMMPIGVHMYGIYVSRYVCTYVRIILSTPTVFQPRLIEPQTLNPNSRLQIEPQTLKPNAGSLLIEPQTLDPNAGFLLTC